MTRRRIFAIVLAGAAAVAVASGGTATARAQVLAPDHGATLAVFQDRVESYAALHRRLAPPPAAAASSDPLSKLLTKRYLAAAIRESRRSAQQGDIFTPDVAVLFRRLLADSIGERDGESFLTELNEGEPLPRGIHPAVNEPYTMSGVYRVPPGVRLGLPPLPSEVDYRIAAHDLVLWDIYAGIVIDLVPDALTSRVTTEE